MVMHLSELIPRTKTLNVLFRNTPYFNVKSLFCGDKGTKGTCRSIRDGNDKIFIN